MEDSYISVGNMPKSSENKNTRVGSPRKAKSAESNSQQVSGARKRAEKATSPLTTSSELDPCEVARLAYSYWEARGCEGGDPAADWYRAEEELRPRRTVAAAAS